jgi:hypothetical protein
MVATTDVGGVEDVFKHNLYLFLLLLRTVE